MYEDNQPLKDFPDYMATPLGEIYTNQVGYIPKLVPGRLNQNGLLMVTLSKDGFQYTRAVGKLVAQSYGVEKASDIFDSIINLDGNRLNNAPMNLAWRPRWFAIKYFQSFKDYTQREREFLRYHNPVICETTNEVFKNVYHAAWHYGLIPEDVYHAVTINHPTWPIRLYFKYYTA